MFHTSTPLLWLLQGATAARETRKIKGSVRLKEVSYWAWLACGTPEAADKCWQAKRIGLWQWLMQKLGRGTSLVRPWNSTFWRPHGDSDKPSDDSHNWSVAMPLGWTRFALSSLRLWMLWGSLGWHAFAMLSRVLEQCLSFPFVKRGKRGCAPTTGGSHSFPEKVYCWKGESSISWTSGRTMRFSSQWQNSRPATII